MTEIVRAEGLSKHYGGFEALSDVSFTIARGSIVGLIGPNGAGKTTALKAILGLTEFDGELDVLGMDPRIGRHKVMERVCFISDVGVLPRWMRVRELIDYVEGVHPGFSRERAEAFLGETDIAPSKKIRQLSKGMVTQLHLAIVMAIDVELLVLDEPTLGLDILYRKSFYDRLLNDYFDHETSILVTTHQVEEIESLLTHLLFIDGGRIVLDSAMDELAMRYADVLVSPENVEAAMALGPLTVRDMLGKKVMLFEDVQRDRLESLGEIHVPSVADLFVAKMKRGRS
ncbi:MAG: ABC transporter ATP-binding protein [Pseudomonadales bacterium]|nr:ABC transporter ATP-binding protein [Pseudomonadales bacterium]